MTNLVKPIHQKKFAPNERRGLVISDLHLFSSRSEGFRLMDNLEKKLANVDLLVLNGDIFDFKWSQLSSEDETITKAVIWLENLIVNFSNLEVHYILGNHDCITKFTGSLKKLSSKHKSLKVHGTQLQIDRLLFLHGECTNWKMDESDLIRFRHAWSQKKTSPRSHALLYDAMDKLGISKGFHNCYYPKPVTVKRVAYHLDKILPNWREKIDHCYFGHTHLAFQNYSLHGVHFHNTGSGIRGMEFLPLDFNINPYPNNK